ncbi:MAG: 16S rRNA (guanine(966)-N(2))-methyltransferase RsmD, partial [Nocardioidaceae bacterium]|nr:16S rRNA (guanine(966)-N(2))-methyltransferase RsmD [Nocardioidaceae bacterium]
MTRIIAGEAGGRRLRTPPGRATRPTSDRVREALFSALEAHLGTLHGCRFLDVFAGSGAIGLEARSRGASAVTLIEQDGPTAALIRANAKQLGMSDVSVIAARVGRLAVDRPSGGRASPFDVAFFDPPYDVPHDQLAQVITDLEQSGWLSLDVLLVVERPRRGDAWRWPAGFEPLREKRYGETVLCYGQRAGADSGGH